MTQQSHSQAYTLRKPKLKKTLFIAAVLTIAGTWKQPRCLSTDEWIKKLWYIYTMDYYSAIKRNTFESVLLRRMNLEPIIHSEVNQKQKDKYHVLMHIYEIQKDGSEECINRAAMEIQTQRIDLWTREMGGEGEMYGKSKWNLTLPYVNQIASGNLLYGSGNSNRGSISTWMSWMGGRGMRGKFKREGIYVYLWLIHVDV